VEGESTKDAEKSESKHCNVFFNSVVYKDARNNEKYWDIEGEKMKHWVIFFIFFIFPSFANAFPYREIEHPPFQLAEGAKIFVVSGPRTGSTLVYNVVHYLFETHLGPHNKDDHKKITKLHALNTELFDRYDSYLISTIRDPVAVVASFCNLYPHPEDQAIRGYCKFASDQFHIAKRGKNLYKNRCLILRYEEFAQDQFDPLFDRLESFFQITIDEMIRDKMKKLFSREAHQQISGKFKTFNEWDPLSGWHGKHINRSTDKDIPENYLEEVKTELAPFCEEWGY